jgi:hypothetical protein
MISMVICFGQFGAQPDFSLLQLRPGAAYNAYPSRGGIHGISWDGEHDSLVTICYYSLETPQFFTRII